MKAFAYFGYAVETDGDRVVYREPGVVELFAFTVTRTVEGRSETQAVTVQREEVFSTSARPIDPSDARDVLDAARLLARKRAHSRWIDGR